jgi:hypothetical protein
MQGDTTTNTPSTNAIFVMTHKQILQISTNRTVTYMRIIIDFCPQKSDPNHVRLTAGENLINYLENSQHKQRISQPLNSCGTASSAQRMQNICASTSKTSTLELHWIALNT